MLNCCIQQRRKREESINNPVITSENADEPEDEDEQFFDAVDQEELTGKELHFAVFLLKSGIKVCDN